MAWSGMRQIQQQLQHLYGTASITTWAWGLAAVASIVALLLLTRGRGEGGLSRQLQLESASASREPLWCLREPQRSYYNKRPCAFHKHSHTLRAAVSAILPVLGFTASENPAGNEGHKERPGCVVLAVVEPTRAWLHSMQDAGLFGACRVLVYPANPHRYSAAVNLFSGVQNSYIKRWSPAEGHSLDAELVTLEEILTGDWGAVAVLSGTDPDVILRGFVQGLRSGRVQAVLWERDGSSGHQRSLLQEVDFFRDLGMAVYLVGAQQQGDAETQDVELGPVLSVHPRLYFADYEPSNARMTVTLLAAKEGSELQGMLDSLAVCVGPAADDEGQSCTCVAPSKTCRLPANPPSPPPEPRLPPPPPPPPSPLPPPPPLPPPEPPAPPPSPFPPPWWYQQTHNKKRGRVR